MSKQAAKIPTTKANKPSLAHRSLVFGVGINDANYNITLIDGGNTLMCPFYRVWTNMLCRCYSGKHHRRKPSYIDCTVCDEWLYFMNFRKWMVAQTWEGLALDKDIMFPGNKVYAPDTSVFVNPEINNLLGSNAAIRGDLPIGVNHHKASGKYRATIKYYGKSHHIGLFITSEKASFAYRKAKRLHVLTIACCETDIRVKQGLYRHSELLR